MPPDCGPPSRATTDWARGGETGRRGGNEWGAGWAGTKENGPRRRKKKREEGEKESWAGLKAGLGKRKAFYFSETVQTPSI